MSTWKMVRGKTSWRAVDMLVGILAAG